MNTTTDFTAQKYTTRACFRCGTELTDAASRERGIGPICAKHDTRVFACTIPADYDTALMCSLTVGEDDVHPECSDTWRAVSESLAGKKRTDNRPLVVQIEWMLSFAHAGDVSKTLRAIVHALGYVALVALWDGEASTGKATVRFDATLEAFVFTGPRNKVGNGKLRALGAHWDGREWTVSARRSLDLALVLRTHWPCCEGMDAALATEYTPQPPAPPVAPVTIAPVSATHVSVRSPYNRDWIDGVKRLPYADRRWDGSAWIVRRSALATVESVTRSVYGAEPRYV